MVSDRVAFPGCSGLRGELFGVSWVVADHTGDHGCRGLEEELSDRSASAVEVGDAESAQAGRYRGWVQRLAGASARKQQPAGGVGVIWLALSGQ